MKTLIKAAAFAAVIAAPMSAMAAKTGDSKDVNFNGTVTHTCAITVGSDGTLGVSGDFGTLGSSTGSGSSGAATVVASGATFKLYVDAPSSWSGPTAPDSASSAVSGDLTVTSAASGGVAVPRGSHDVDVDMTATTASFFEEGDYSAVVTLRCE
ncbi:MAG: hypothetical protein KDJ80_15655 [Nitratireductor sp.]|nr:hypothetical protein [Nitratireductor sp.]